MPELNCSRCLKPVGQLIEGNINYGVRLVCPNCDDKKMSDGIPHSLPEFLRLSPSINQQMARAGKESK